MALNVGDAAPSFCLSGHDGKEYCLPELLKRSRVVLVFYPYDQSPTCSKLLCSINDDLAEFKAAGITLLGINNGDEQSHRRFAEKKHLKMPLLSDMNFAVSRHYGALFRIGPIRAIRYASIGIEQDGRISFFEYGRPDNATIISGMSAEAAVA